MSRSDGERPAARGTREHSDLAPDRLRMQTPNSCTSDESRDRRSYPVRPINEEVAMTPAARAQLARDLYLAFADGDRELVESRLADEFTFSSPVDVGLDRAAYFE